jgi:alkaline phosphatase D
MMLTYFLGAPLFALSAVATYEGNLNYGSPSRRHPSLGIDVPKVKLAKRGLNPRAVGPSKLNFTHGVASGDPYPDSVILWTRISPVLENDRSKVTVSGYAPMYNHDTEQYIKASKNPICVEYRVAADRNFSAIATKGTAYTTSDIDYTVKVEAKDLKPFTTYYYQFNVCGADTKSPVGRTKTSPAADDDVTGIGFAVFSCSNYRKSLHAFGLSVLILCSKWLLQCLWKCSPQGQCRLHRK